MSTLMYLSFFDQCMQQHAYQKRTMIFFSSFFLSPSLILLVISMTMKSNTIVHVTQLLFLFLIVLLYKGKNSVRYFLSAGKIPVDGLLLHTFFI